MSIFIIIHFVGSYGDAKIENETVNNTYIMFIYHKFVKMNGVNFDNLDIFKNSKTYSQIKLKLTIEKLFYHHDFSGRVIRQIVHIIVPLVKAIRRDDIQDSNEIDINNKTFCEQYRIVNNMDFGTDCTFQQRIIKAETFIDIKNVIGFDVFN